MLTKDCQKKYLHDLRCKVSDYIYDTTKSISIARGDQECMIQRTQVLDSFLESIEYYVTFDKEVNYAHQFTFKRTDSQQITVTITIGSNSISVTDDGDEETFVQAFYKKINNNTQNPADLKAEYSSNHLYIYSFSSNINSNTSTSVSITQGVDQDNEVSNTNISDDLSPILDVWNCLTQKEICKIINGAYDLLPRKC